MLRTVSRARGDLPCAFVVLGLEMGDAGCSGGWEPGGCALKQGRVLGPLQLPVVLMSPAVWPLVCLQEQAANIDNFVQPLHLSLWDIQRDHGHEQTLWAGWGWGTARCAPLSEAPKGRGRCDPTLGPEMGRWSCMTRVGPLQSQGSERARRGSESETRCEDRGRHYRDVCASNTKGPGAEECGRAQMLCSRELESPLEPPEVARLAAASV